MIKLEVKKTKNKMEVNFNGDGVDIIEVLYGIARLWLVMTNCYKLRDKDVLKGVKLTMKDMKAQDDK